MKKGLTQVALGAGLMYFLDPDRGPRRRALVRDKYTSLMNDLDDWACGVYRDLENRWNGLRAEVMSLFTPDQELTDEVLEARVRSRLGRLVSHPKAIRVLVANRHCTLEGPVLAAEAPGLLAGARLVRGVRHVENHLEMHDGPGDVPALQGGSALDNARQWSPGRRIVSGAIGGTLALHGLKRGGVLGAAMAVLGTSMLTRGITNATVGEYLSGGGRHDGSRDRRRERTRERGLSPTTSPSGGI